MAHQSSGPLYAVRNWNGNGNGLKPDPYLIAGRSLAHRQGASLMVPSRHCVQRKSLPAAGTRRSKSALCASDAASSATGKRP
jgi:hypothetical protein